MRWLFEQYSDQPLATYDYFSDRARKEEGFEYIRGYGAVFESEAALTAFLLKWTY